MRPFGLIVGVESLQTLVKRLGKVLQRVGFFGKFYEPLMPALGLIVHVNGCCGILRHLCSGLLAGIVESFLGIVHNQFLAKGIDEVFCPAGDDELIRIPGGECHGVAYLISPQSARC